MLIFIQQCISLRTARTIDRFRIEKKLAKSCNAILQIIQLRHASEKLPLRTAMKLQYSRQAGLERREPFLRLKNKYLSKSTYPPSVPSFQACKKHLWIVSLPSSSEQPRISNIIYWTKRKKRKMSRAKILKKLKIDFFPESTWIRRKFRFLLTEQE